MNKILNTKESAFAEQNWTSKKELAEFCKCSDKTLEQIISSLSIEVNFDTQSHIKKGGYHNLKPF